MDTDDRAPEGRCGYVLEPGDVPVDTADELEPGSDQWYETSDAVCCWRPSWDGAEDGRCIWHAMTDEKPAETPIATRAKGPKRLDGRYVPAVELGDTIDFEECGSLGGAFDRMGL